MSIITHKSNLGNLQYPFFNRLARDWYIRTWSVADNDPSLDARSLQHPWHETRPDLFWSKDDDLRRDADGLLADADILGLDTEALLNQHRKPTLRWVKDDKVCDLYVRDMSTAQFLAAAGLDLSLRKGGFVLSKRLSRIFRPFRYFAFFSPHQVIIDHNPALDPAVWDGAGLISRALVNRIAANLDPHHPDHKAHLHELQQTRRFEITVLHPGGQEKGHVLVFEDDAAPLNADLIFPPGSAKTELKLHDALFIGLQPVHARNNMRLDIQSLVNLHPFFRPEHLLAWLEHESDLFLHAIRNGRFDQLLSFLGRFSDERDFTQFRGWWLADYLLSGGRLIWFPGPIRAMARQHLNRLQNIQRKPTPSELLAHQFGAAPLPTKRPQLRWPIPGGHYYIFPAQIGDRDVPPGHVQLDPRSATAWVSTADWTDHIVPILGGCDGDDGVWAFPFTDHDRQPKILLWRSPNQVGEYLLLKPTPASHPITWPTTFGDQTYPHMDSRQLPPRIDAANHTYGQLPRFPAAPAEAYTIAAMIPIIRQVRANKGVLGAYCNTLLVTKALYGRLPTNLPARLEDVIDGSVKSGRNLTPVTTWCATAAAAIVRTRKPVPAILHRRISLSLPKKDRRRIQTSANHWLDALLEATNRHIDMYQANAEALAADAQPPAALVQHRHWIDAGDALRHLYADGVRANRSLAAIQTDCQNHLATWNGNHPFVLIGAALSAMTDAERSDAVLWQPEIAPLTVQALRQIGLLGTPIWMPDQQTAELYHHDPIPTAVPVQLNGVWFAWLQIERARADQDPYPTMSAVPKPLRDAAKQRVAAAIANGRFADLILHMRPTQSDRLIATTDKGATFAYVKAGHELRAVKHPTWRIAHALPRDGNLLAVLTPAACA